MSSMFRSIVPGELLAPSDRSQHGPKNPTSHLRILVVHNRYKIRGGEDSVVESEIALLRRHGHVVHEYIRSNDSLDSSGRLEAAMNATWNRDGHQEMLALIDDVKPTLIHVHNTFHLISPSIYWAAAKRGIPVVQTLHNFRLLCPQAMFLRDGKVCEDCLHKVPWRGVVRRCYRDSLAQSAVLAGIVVVHRGLGTWRNKIARYVALNEFCRDKFIEGGIPAERIVVKPNFVESPPRLDGPRSGLLYVGRLSKEKGLSTLAGAMRAFPDLPLVVAGSGTEASHLEDLANVQCLGEVSNTDVNGLMHRAQALVLPSLWYEGFPRTVVEAFAAGLPVIASRIGSLAEVIEEGINGILFEPGNADDLKAKIAWCRSNPAAVASMGHRARLLFEQKYSARANYARLMEIYGDAIRETAQRQA